MANTDYALVFSSGIASSAPYGTAVPTGMTALSAPWTDFGAISTAGIAETVAETRSSFKRFGSITPFKTVVTDQAKSFDLAFLESNANVLGLFFKTATPTPTGAGTNEVQTATITGAPTGGTFVLVYANAATTDLPYNATASAVQTALQALPGIGAGNVTVTGSAGGPYTITFAGTLAAANIVALATTGNFTGGTSPAIAVTTPTQGATGSLLSITDDVAGVQDIRAWTLDLIQGTNHVRFYLPNAEVTARKNPTYVNTAITEYGVTISAYVDPTLGYAIQRQYLLHAVSGV